MNAHEDNPWHALALVVLGNEICGQNTTQELEERRIETQHREEEQHGHADVEQVSESGLAPWDAHEQTAKGVGN